VVKRGREGLQKVGGLRVRHYDPVTQRLYVIRTKQSKEDQASKKVTEIKVIPAIAAILEKHSQGKAPDDFIFCFKDKSPIMDIRWAFDEAVSFAGIRLKEVGSCGENLEMRLQFRDLRHVAANNLIESGLGMEEVAYYLGHSSTTMLQAVYYTRRKGSQLEHHAALVEKGMGRVLG
jgi:integrase